MAGQVSCANTTNVPFDTMEEAWFWFMRSVAAGRDGAMQRAGLAQMPRPCEPSDFLNILDRLYQKRILLIDHLRVLSHYGERLYPPNPRRPKEARSYYIWLEALSHLEPILRAKGILA